MGFSESGRSAASMRRRTGPGIGGSRPRLQRSAGTGSAGGCIRVEHGIAHLKNWRALARHLGRREHMDDTVQAVAGPLSQQQTVDLFPAWQS
ncbi:hypothetical protein [Streptomyces sp. NPDC048295]|uniref:hypothetical protein n=1 Tax=Streptomyces sp. NPDC048295 TaxID=3154617 RepID=UPI00342B9D81